MFDRENIKDLITVHTRRLLKLKEQQARLGIDTPPHILIDIEDIEAEIAQLQFQLAQAKPILSRENQHQLINPFYTGGRINDPRYFFGRNRLLREIQSELKKRANISLVGEPQLGKSSLLYYLYLTRADWLPNGTVTYIDLQGVLDEEDFCETVLSKLGQEGRTLRHLKWALQDRDVVLLLDEVERLAEHDFNPRLHDLLRALAQDPNFAMVLTTQRPLIEVFPVRAAGGVSPFHNIFTTRFLRPFTENESRAFLLTRLENSGIFFTEDEINHIFTESQGHPAKLQLLAKTLFSEKMSL